MHIQSSYSNCGAQLVLRRLYMRMRLFLTSTAFATAMLLATGIPARAADLDLGLVNPEQAINQCQLTPNMLSCCDYRFRHRGDSVVAWFRYMSHRRDCGSGSDSDNRVEHASVTPPEPPQPPKPPKDNYYPEDDKPHHGKHHGKHHDDHHGPEDGEYHDSTDDGSEDDGPEDGEYHDSTDDGPDGGSEEPSGDNPS